MTLQIYNNCIINSTTYRFNIICVLIIPVLVMMFSSAKKSTSTSVNMFFHVSSTCRNEQEGIEFQILNNLLAQ